MSDHMVSKYLTPAFGIEFDCARYANDLFREHADDYDYGVETE